MIKAISWTLATIAAAFLGSYLCLEAELPKWSMPPTASLFLIGVWAGTCLSISAWMDSQK